MNTYHYLLLGLMIGFFGCQKSPDVPVAPAPLPMTVTGLSPASGSFNTTFAIQGRGFSKTTSITVEVGTTEIQAVRQSDSLIAATLSVSTLIGVQPVRVRSTTETATSPVSFTIISLVSVSGNITQNTVWQAANCYLLASPVVVRAGATLTIEPGTIIYGTQRSGLFIEPGAKLLAEGKADKPIVFTSAKPSGSRDLGDWPGLFIVGNAPINQADMFKTVSSSQIFTELAVPGRNNSADNSGVLKYVQIEYAGGLLGPVNDYGLCLIGVGSGTTIDYVQIRLEKRNLSGSRVASAMNGCHYQDDAYLSINGMKFTDNWGSKYEGWPAGAPEIDVRVFAPSSTTNFSSLGEIRFIDNAEPNRRRDINNNWWGQQFTVVYWDKESYSETLLFDFTEDDDQIFV